MIIESISSDLSLNKKLDLLNLSKGLYYYKPVEKDESNLANMIYNIWKDYPFYGYRKITSTLKSIVYRVNHKRVLRIMNDLQIKAIASGPHTSMPSKQHVRYPYLLKDIDICRANQVWQTDITYIRLPGGFVCLLAFIDFYSRYIVGWHIINMMDISLL
ncbi:MAG: IS3 family transposase [Pseudomonadota bacterium]